MESLSLAGYNFNHEDTINVITDNGGDDEDTRLKKGCYCICPKGILSLVCGYVDLTRDGEEWKRTGHECRYILRS